MENVHIATWGLGNRNHCFTLTGFTVSLYSWASSRKQGLWLSVWVTTALRAGSSYSEQEGGGIWTRLLILPYMRAVEYRQDQSPTHCRSLVERAGGLTWGLPQGFKPLGLSLQNKVQRNSWKLLLKFMAASSFSDLPLKVGDLQGSLLGVSPSLSIH